MKAVVTAVIGLFVLVTPMSAQQTSTADGGPTLAVTMQFLQEKLGSQGVIRFAEHTIYSPQGKTTVYDVTEEITNVKPNVQACTLKFHHKSVKVSQDPEDQTWVDGKLQKRGTPWDNSEHVINLASPLEISVLPAGRYSAEGPTTRISGVPQTLTVTTDPPIFVLKIGSEKYKDGLYLPDEVIADRISKALQHAVELCKPLPAAKAPVKDNSRKPNDPF